MVLTIWLLSEYKEPEKSIILTDKEKLFIKYIVEFFGIDVWLIRSKSYLANVKKDLYIFDSNPCSNTDGINWDIKNYWCKNTSDILDFITSDNPYKIADLLQYLDK